MMLQSTFGRHRTYSSVFKPRRYTSRRQMLRHNLLFAEAIAPDGREAVEVQSYGHAVCYKMRKKLVMRLTFRRVYAVGGSFLVKFTSRYVDVNYGKGEL